MMIEVYRSDDSEGGFRLVNKYYFGTRQLLIIALFSGLGAVLSTYVGYLGRTFGAMTGLPAGGQIFTGLQFFWIVLVLVVGDKKGAGLLAAIFDNSLQFLMGSHLGILLLPVGLLEGVFAELGYWPLKRFGRIAPLVVAGGLGSWSNLLVHQLASNRFGNVYLFGAVSAYSLVSGVIFPGIFPWYIHSILRKTGLVPAVQKPAQTIAGPASVPDGNS
jgi:ABC-type thiamin/hydroxymethylpyrimidine transport system permease subunit